MKKIDLGQTITILANVGVIAGIVFLAFEIQQNNEFLAAQSRAVRVDIRTDYSETMFAEPGIVQAIVRARNGFELSDEDRHRLRFLAIDTFVKWQYVYGEYQRGMIEESELAPAAWRNTFWNEVPGMSEVWEDLKENYQPVFMEYMEHTIVDPQ